MSQEMKTLNEVYSSLSTRRRYEVWFLRLALADGDGAWWFRYLLMNPGRGGCGGDPALMPVQVWATRFAENTVPHTFIQGFAAKELRLSRRGQAPFHFEAGENEIAEDSCRGHLAVDGHEISWDLRYSSTFRTTLSNKGWIGFARTPHSDGVFSGEITFDGQTMHGQPLGYGIQGHNCGYRHRNFWIWAHAFFPRPDGPPSTLEALVYDMPFKLTFRKAVFWHEGKKHVFRNLDETARDRKNMMWSLRCSARDGRQLNVTIDGRGPLIHHLPYFRTDCCGSFEVANNSLARASVRFRERGGPDQTLETTNGAVLEMGGQNAFPS